MASATTVQPNFFALFAEFDMAEQQRMNNIAKYWEFYDGDQWGVIREEGESLITFNYSKAVVDKSVSFLFGKGFKFMADKEIDHSVKPLLEEVWEYNDKEIIGLEIGQMGGVTGDCFVKVGWQDADTDDDGVAYDEEYPEGKVKLSVLPTSSVHPEYSSHDKDKMLSCKIQYIIMEDDIRGKKKAKVYKEVITRDYIRTYLDDILQTEEENSLREINVVHIKNVPLAGETYGQSDLKQVVPLQKELNSKVTDVSDIINYHSAPITIIQGAKAKNLEKGAKKVWGGLPKDAKVFNLELNSDLGAANEYIDKVKTTLHELSNVPEDSLGGKSAVSNTTGVALQIKYSPLLEKTWIKRQTYGRGIQKINRLIVKLLHITGDDKTVKILDDILKDKESIRKAYNIKVVFPDPLPKDEMVQLQLIAQKMNMGIEEPEGALQSLGYEGDIEEKLAKIRKYQKEQQDLMFELDSKENPEDVDIAGIASQYNAKPEEEIEEE